MAKFNLGINGQDQGAAEGREAWSGELPPTGSYEGVVKVMSIGEIGPEAQNAGATKISVGVELRCSEKGSPLSKYDGYIAWGNLNMIEASIPFVNQFLLALTDGSDEQFEKVKGWFYNPDTLIVDERKKHIVRIGQIKIDSPEGETPIKISLTNTPFTNKKTNVTTQQVRIQSYLLGAGGASAAVSSSTEGPMESEVEEEATVDLEPEDADELLT